MAKRLRRAWDRRPGPSRCEENSATAILEMEIKETQVQVSLQRRQ
jgi:hypothetical protein